MFDNDKTTKDVSADTPVWDEKARDFLVYVSDRAFLKIAAGKEGPLGAVMESWARLLPETAFPFKKSNGAMLFIPSGMILNELLYSDMHMTLFFMKFAEFQLLLILLRERYPEFFDFIIKKPCKVPESLPVNANTAAEKILHRFFKKGRTKNSVWESDPLLFRVVSALVECRYLPLGMDYTAYNEEIIAGIRT